MAKENDLYYGDLILLKKRVSEWQEAHPKGRINKPVKLAAIVVGLALILGAYYIDPEAASKSGISVFTMTILVVLLAMIFLSRKLNAMMQPPFAKLYNARFEASDDGIICYYQQKMSEYHYFIKDKNIKKWIIDSDVNCMYIEGKASLSTTTKDGENPLGSIDAFYMLIPFDQFDLDDLVAPYGDLVEYRNGTLREQFMQEKTDLPIIIKEKAYKKKSKSIQPAE